MDSKLRRSKESECRRIHHGDLIAIQLRFYLRNILGSVIVKNLWLDGALAHHKD